MALLCRAAQKKNALYAKAGIDTLPGGIPFEIAKWLLKEFGPEVNLENVDIEDAYIIEAMRHGLHRAVDYDYFHAWRGKRLPPVPPAP